MSIAGLASVSNASARVRGMTTSVQNATIRFEHRIAIVRPCRPSGAIARLKLPGGRFINACEAVAVDPEFTHVTDGLRIRRAGRDSRNDDHVRTIRTKLGSGERLHGPAAGGQESAHLSSAVLDRHVVDRGPVWSVALPA